MVPMMLIFFDDSEDETANEYLLAMHVVTYYCMIVPVLHFLAERKKWTVLFILILLYYNETIPFLSFVTIRW